VTMQPRNKILLVDDDANILQAFKRQLRGEFDVETAIGGKAGLEQIERGEFAVVVSDMQMPEINGIDFLKAVQGRSPNTVRLMLTGNVDQGTAARAVNEGKIFRFLNKPCSTEDLAKALKDALEHYRLITLEKDLLQNTLSGSVKLLTDILSMVDPGSFGKVAGLREIIRKLALGLGIKNSWEIELGAMLSNIGAVVLPAHVLAKLNSEEKLTRDEKLLVDQIPETGRKLLSNIPRLEKVAQIVLCQNKHFNGSGFPVDERKGHDIPLGARILKVVSDFKELETRGLLAVDALTQMKQREGWYDDEVLGALHRFLIPEKKKAETTETKIYEVKLGQLCSGQILLADVRSSDGVLLICSGTTVSETLIEKIKNYAQFVGIKDPFQVNCYIPCSDE